MDAKTIIDQLSADKGLPRAALAAASERREEMAPLFIAEIENYLAKGESKPSSANAIFFMFHLLGQWRETSAYRTLARLLRLPDDDIARLLGDGVTETSHRVMAAVFDGDPQPLYDIILDTDASEFTRSRMCEALAMVVLLGKLDRKVVAVFLRDCFTHLEPQDQCFVWQGWQAAIARLGLKEMTPLVKEAFTREYISSSWLRFEDYLGDMEKALAGPGIASWDDNGEYQLFGDTIEELSHWDAFVDKRHRKERRQTQRLAPLPGAPVVSPHKTVGRNDPCPCGSGKKFKKCCLK